ncbi:hypothetical protein [Tuwongella immobilis]|uniref:MoxR-vWA-beta-propeller ternary system domain-containing protein n=1 Tax=Tuwongella immobilis TaxID=692036 RepID=A0A6C2YID1_9BACT|nr:hypothetical protein [Tuwongella immobilis]VIP01031.1 Uncharacterized protein OS=Singulisphaera acidiphila (strain ATCC BAA-1392 / DSM 18658 / VKM B-2454 / MOB10) GN=Sinac_2121 PE=4 SV=1 [Tuwongella immobilis]VTR97487.1 Uncharacterized protein OS=Singulisphaera acidiphila (strain ATCC BAA-1392 / DSM 18658 / VKM B-2454 / MOB10) GN=Sinac_2121 PE=4 SV=1 [Tuwongella immobilis]
MATFAEFLHSLLIWGEVALLERPILTDAGRAESLQLLRQVGERHLDSLPGPRLELACETALSVAEWFADLCWWIVASESPQSQAWNRGVPVPHTPAEHFAGDWILRFCGMPERRLRFRPIDDPVRTGLDAMLRAWPFSGVRFPIDAPPTTPLDFGGHLGMQWQYAQRLRDQPRPGWLPTDPDFRERIELAFAQVNRPMPGALDRPDDAPPSAPLETGTATGDAPSHR